METVYTTTSLLYMLSTAGYLIYLFLQKGYLQRLGYALLLAGFLCHTVIIVSGFIESGIIPVGNLRETLCLAGWTVAGVFLIIKYRYNIKILGIYAAPFIALIMVIVSHLPQEPAQTPTIFKSLWLITHVIVILVGEAAFALACGIGED